MIHHIDNYLITIHHPFLISILELIEKYSIVHLPFSGLIGTNQEKQQLERRFQMCPDKISLAPSRKLAKQGNKTAATAAQHLGK